jgi:phosphoglycerate dehydrogenase-like enzyme
MGLSKANNSWGHHPADRQSAMFNSLNVSPPIAHQTVAIRASYWEDIGTILLRGKTLGIIGTGGICTQVARLGNAFDMHVIA